MATQLEPEQQPDVQATTSVREHRFAALVQFIDADAVRWVALLVWMGVIFYLSAQPRLPSLPEYDTLFKKTAHFCAYGLLALLAQRALHRTPRAALGAWLMAVVYAISDEWHQSFVPGRHPMATDVLIDATGAACALLLWHWLWHTKQVKRKTYDSG